MEISLQNAVILLCLGVVAGFINTVSAAGSLVSITALMFTGLTALQANASNRVAVMAQNFSSTYTFIKNGYKPDRYVIWLSLASIPGAVLGALFSVKIPEEWFIQILSGVMILFLLITLFNPLKNAKGGEERMDKSTKAFGLFLFFLFGIYGGFIQAGSGFFLMAGCMMVHRFDFAKSNFYKSVIMFSFATTAFLVFVFKGQIVWVHGLILALGMSIGGYIGVHWSIKTDEATMKRITTAIILALLAYLWFFH